MKLKKILVLGLALTMLLGSTMNVGATFNRSYTAPKGTPTVDAEYDDVWATAPWTNVDKSWDGNADTNSVLRIKCLWDETHFYFYAEVYDEHQNKRNDLVEIYLDQKNDKVKDKYNEDDSQTRFYVHKSGVVKGAADVAGENAQFDALSANKSIGENMYAVEGALSWASGITPAIGTKMGLEFMYNDGNLYNAFSEAFRWNADTANGDEPPYAGTSCWGTLILGDVAQALAADTYVEGESKIEGGQKLPENNNKTDGNASVDANGNPVGDTDAADTDADDTKGGMDTKTIVVIAALAVIVVAIIVILLSGKKKKSE